MGAINLAVYHWCRQLDKLLNKAVLKYNNKHTTEMNTDLLLQYVTSFTSTTEMFLRIYSVLHFQSELQYFEKKL